MPVDRWRQVEELFHAAAALSGERREEFLRSAGADAALIAEVRALLECETAPNDALDAPACALAAEALSAYKQDFLAGRQIGPYRIERQIGLGGMGVVYLAHDAQGRRVAVKLIRRSWLEDSPGQTVSRLALRRFVTEQRALAALDHPFVARLLDAGSTAGQQPYLVMEYVAGTAIDQYCDEHALSIEQRIGLFRKVCTVVQYAHQNLIVHRDLKPANILVTPDGTPKLLDFGIAKLLPTPGRTAAAGTQTVIPAMTPRYASPEQIRGEPISTATDVYALGVILYELLCGHNPHTAAPGGRFEQAICDTQPDKPSTMLTRVSVTAEPGATETVLTPAAVARTRRCTPEKLQRMLSGDLDTIVLTALRKEPERRYPSVERLSDDLRCHLQGLPVSARGDTFGYLAGKFIRRNKAAVIAAGLVLLTLVGGIVATTWQAYRARQAELQATQLARAEARQRQITDEVNLFLHEMLASPPRSTVSEVLERALERIAAGRFAGHVLLRAQLETTLGCAYGSLGDYGKAAALLGSALQIRRQWAGDDHPLVGLNLQDLAQVLRKTSQYAAAEALQREGLAILRQAHGAAHADVAVGLSNLALIRSDRGDHAAAELLSRQAIPGLLGADRTRDLAACLGNLADVLIRRGAFAEAERLLREVIILKRDLYTGPSARPAAVVIEPYWGLDLNSLAQVVRQKGDLPAAIALQREAMAIVAGHFGKDHDQLATLRNNLGGLLLRSGDYAGAEEAYRQALRQGLAKWPDGHPSLAARQTNLATALLYRGAHRAAEHAAREALAMKRRQWGPMHAEVAHTLAVLAAAVHRGGAPRQAAPLYREAIAIVDGRLPGDHPLVCALLDGLGGALSESDAPGAAALLQQAADRRRQRAGEEHLEYARSLLSIGRHVQRAGNLALAEQRLRAGLAIVRSAGPRVEAASVLLELAEVLLRQERAAEAAALLREAAPLAPGDARRAERIQAKIASGTRGARGAPGAGRSNE